MLHKAPFIVTAALFLCSMGMQGAGLQPAVRPCCAAKVRQVKQDGLELEKRKKTKRTQKEIAS